MQKSLAMLINVVDYEDKKLQLEGLKNRLEAMASPKLVQAFNTGNLGMHFIVISFYLLFFLFLCFLTALYNERYLNL